MLRISIRQREVHWLCVTFQISIMTNSVPEAKKQLPTLVSVILNYARYTKEQNNNEDQQPGSYNTHFHTPEQPTG